MVHIIDIFNVLVTCRICSHLDIIFCKLSAFLCVFLCKDNKVYIKKFKLRKQTNKRIIINVLIGSSGLANIVYTVQLLKCGSVSI